MSGADRLEDGFPHGTAAGYDRGCKGGWCPAGNEHGLSCSRAKKLTAGDYRFGRLVKQGFTPADIAFELGLVPETHEPPKARKAVDDGMEETETVEGDEEPMEEANAAPAVEAKSATDGTRGGDQSKKPRRAPLASTALTQVERAEVRAWAARDGVAIPRRGPLPKSVIEAYRAAHDASSEAQADEARVPERPKPTPPRKLRPMKPAKQPPALAEPEEHELAAVAEAVKVAIVHGPVVPDMETRAELFNDGFRTAEAQFAPLVDELIAEGNAARIALDLTLRKWGEERGRADARKALVIDLSAQVIAAEHERRADGELIASMDRVLRDAQDVIENLRRELAEARRGRSWWKAAS